MEVRLHVDRCNACSTELDSFGKIARMIKDDEQSHPPQGFWGQISVRLDERAGIRHIRVMRILKASLVPVLLACLLISVGMWWRCRSDVIHAHNHASLAVNMQRILAQFSEDPVKVVDTLSEEYAGRKVSFDDAEKLYYERLNAVRTLGDWEGWTSFFLECVRDSADDGVTTARRLFSVVGKDRDTVLHHRAATIRCSVRTDGFSGRVNVRKIAARQGFKTLVA